MIKQWAVLQIRGFTKILHILKLSYNNRIVNDLIKVRNELVSDAHGRQIEQPKRLLYRRHVFIEVDERMDVGRSLVVAPRLYVATVEKRGLEALVIIDRYRPQLVPLRYQFR